MANPAFETVDSPFTTFRFEIVLDTDEPLPGIDNPICNAAFAECDGLEMSMEPKTVQEGGNNSVQTHLIGPVKYSQLTLRRGMTNNLHLWNWFVAAAEPGHVSTATGHVTMWDADSTPRVTFVLKGCLPVKMRGPSFNAKDGLVAIEEMQLVYASLELRPAGANLGFGIGFSAGVSASASIGGSVSVGGSASFGASASAGLSVG